MKIKQTITIFLMICTVLAFSGCVAGGGSGGGDGGKDSVGNPEVRYDFYVDAVSGIDANDGSSELPFKTITHAIEISEIDKSIKIQPGTYDSANGEIFPITLKTGQELIGDVANKGDGISATVINGTGNTASGWITIIGTENTVIKGLKIQDSSSEHTSVVWIEDITMEVSSNTFSDGDTGIRIVHSGNSLISDNVINTSSYGICFLDCTGNLIIQNNSVLGNTGYPISISGATNDTLIKGNTIIGNGYTGIQFNGNCHARIVGNTFNGNYFNGAIWCSFIATSKIRDNVFICDHAININGSAFDPIPDLGTAGDQGGNNFSAVTGYSIQLHVDNSETIYAIGNTFPNTPPTDSDIINNGVGKIWYGTGASDFF